MKKLGFEKNKSKYCMYCIHGKPLESTEEVFCIKKGFVDKFSKCRKYKYDPLKRKPESKTVTSKYSSEDFKL